MKEKVFYVYKLYNTVLDKYYIGSRTISNTIDILNGYNTSSKIVHSLIKTHGIETFKVVYIKQYDTAKKAVDAESRLLKSINVDDRINYLNLNFSAGGAVLILQTHLRIYNTITKEYSYYPRDLELPENCILKSRSKPPNVKGLRKFINIKTDEIKYMYPSENNDSDFIEIVKHKEYIDKNLGKRLIWINDGVKNTKIYDGDELPEGWNFGKIVKWTKFIITNGNEDKYIENNKTIPDGWWRGTCRDNSHTKGMIRITNGIKTTTIKPTDTIPDGWWRGTVTSGKKIYYIDDKVFYLKKDLIKYLNVTPTKFDVDYKKGVYKNLIVKEKQK